MSTTPTTEAAWRADGAPWEPAPWILAFERMAKTYGFIVYVIGDESHLSADPPEDHTPYSATGWPGSNPYPFVLACDIMPNTNRNTPGGTINLGQLGAQIEADRQANKPGAVAIKYINWTETDGQCVHDSWEPGFAERASSDTGHIHISVRTDRYDLGIGSWDPFAAVLMGALAITPVSVHSGGFDMATVSTLVKGSSGWEVKSLQALLNGHDFRDERGASLAVDGIFGDHTLAAVRHAQSAGGLQVDGEAGPHTRSYLETGHDLA